ncbi:MAG: GNAT family protein [Bdellovibrionales bacterium]|jgi:ribosomal-protein-alanine N-acetyltransferase|nr:GNAT family protein [Bdellovibrionales bacterium]
MLASLWKRHKPALPPRLDADRIYLRLPEASDAEAWVAQIQRNAEFLRPWSPASSLRQVNRHGFTARRALWQYDSRQGCAHVFFIFRQDDNALIGGITLGNIMRSAAQMATIGYWLDGDLRGRGLMAEAVGRLSDYAFNDMGLHRLQAGCLPENRASHRVLEKNGFQAEGIARGYIKIDGTWRDHLIFSKLAEE